MTTAVKTGPVEETLRKVGAQIDRLFTDDHLTKIDKDLESIRGRLEDLRLQAALGKMEVRDRLAPTLDALEAIIGEIRAQMSEREEAPSPEETSSQAS
jgi:hypothetical protein